MPTGMAPGQVTTLLNAIRGNATYQLTNHYIQLHNGDPGALGTANVINNGARVLVTFNPPAGSQMASAAAAEWVSWVGTGTPTHFTSWSQATGGTFQLSGIVVADGTPVDGSTATIPAGGLVYTHDVASA